MPEERIEKCNGYYLTWSSDRTCRYRGITHADSTDKRTEVKYILNEKMYISFSKTCEKQVLEKLFFDKLEQKIQEIHLDSRLK